MCNCKNKDEKLFLNKLEEAKNIETKKTKWGVYYQEFPNGKTYPFIAKVKDIINNDSICCYYTSDGQKIDK